VNGSAGTRARIALAGCALALVVAIASCGRIQDLVSGRCARAASDWGADFKVSGAFATTVGAVRAAVSSSRGVIPPDLADATPASLCYLDGDFPLSPPPPPNGQIPPGYDRALIVVAGDVVALLQAGYQDSMGIRDPTQPLD
jgi:hypothetical protein